jgi:Zn finger protein HypA/HybF involved in hydrogenase expression
MPYDPVRKAYVVTTVRDYLDCGYTYTAYCYEGIGTAAACGHSSDVDLIALGEKRGLDYELKRLRFVCSKCGSRKMQVRTGSNGQSRG